MWGRFRFIVLLGVGVFAVSISAVAQTTLGQEGICAEATMQFQEDNQAFQNLSRDCRGQAGADPAANIDDCPSVNKDLFITLVRKLEDGRYRVCQSCRGTWPKRDLGEGTCSGE
jgi:hypothetical protein